MTGADDAIEVVLIYVMDGYVVFGATLPDGENVLVQKERDGYWKLTSEHLGVIRYGERRRGMIIDACMDFADLLVAERREPLQIVTVCHSLRIPSDTAPSPPRSRRAGQGRP